METNRRVRGFSLVEVLVALTVLASTAVVYGSVFRQQLEANRASSEFQVATSLFLRQVELLRSKNLVSDAGAYPVPPGPTDFLPDCVPYPYTASSALVVVPRDELNNDTFLTAARSLELPTTSSWHLFSGSDPLFATLQQEGYELNVRMSRVYFAVGDTGDRLLKVTIRVNTTHNSGGGGPRNILTEDIYLEVRHPQEVLQ